MKTHAVEGHARPFAARAAHCVTTFRAKFWRPTAPPGFQRISTPILEDMENLDKSDGGDNLNLIFKVLKRGDKLAAALRSGDEKQLSDMGLRYDLTLPLSRYYAANRQRAPQPLQGHPDRPRLPCRAPAEGPPARVCAVRHRHPGR